MNIRIYKINDIDGFFKTVEKCRGRIELITEDGDCLNLKSRLTQYVSLAKVFSDGSLTDLSLRTADKEDAALILDFLIHDKPES